jgi:FkbM family methyltransferase
MSTEPQNEIPRHSLMAPIAIMRRHGVAFRSFIDIGCADGTFSLECLALFGRDLTICNIDAQRIYEPSLLRIRQKVGGHQKITAISETDGWLRFSISEKSPYWSRASENGDYVESRSLDSLLEEFTLPEPYLIKMDIEGAELGALRGAKRSLDKVAGLVLETGLRCSGQPEENFLDIYRYLADRNFSLFDVVNFGYRPEDQVLFEVYSVFLNRKYDFREWVHHESDSMQQAELTAAMAWRRKTLLARNEELLNRLS